MLHSTCKLRVLCGSNSIHITSNCAGNSIHITSNCAGNSCNNSLRWTFSVQVTATENYESCVPGCVGVRVGPRPMLT